MMQPTSGHGALHMLGSSSATCPRKLIRIQDQVLYAGYQELYQRPVTVEHVRRYPIVGRNAYTAEKGKWFDATYTFLAGQLDDAERAKRMLSAKKRARRAATPAAAPAAPAPAAEAAHTPRKSTTAVENVDTEDEDEPSLVTQSTKKRGRNAR